jgi:hypothetical protein
MFKEHNITPSTFNVISKPITEIRTKKSDHNNGYYIAEGLWGTCFHRVASLKDRFEVVGNNNPNCPHTYTKIPQEVADKTFFIYINYKTGFTINLPDGAIVVGLHEAQKHKKGGWYSQSVLVYSPTGEQPQVEETTDLIDTKAISVSSSKGGKLFLTLENLLLGFPIRYIALNEDGYYMPKGTRPDRERVFPNKSAGTKFSDLLTKLQLQKC